MEIVKCSCCGSKSPSAAGFLPRDETGKERGIAFRPGWDPHACGTCNDARCTDRKAGSPCAAKLARDAGLRR